MVGGFGGLAPADSAADLVGVSKILGPTWLQLPALTIGLLGVQVFWSIEMSYGTPYLISLGLSKAAVAVVFLAGPLSGLIVQPLIGVLADNSKSRFGRRRPYMLAGACICVSAMLFLGFARPAASLFTAIGSRPNHVLTIWLAILALFSIDFSINAVQAVDRALIVDTLPPLTQADGNAWAARMLGIGSVAGYFLGNIDMTTVFPFLGDTELEVLSVFGSVLLVAMQLITAVCTKEKVVIASKHEKKSLLGELKDIWDNARNLPSTIRQICIIQFFAWIGWFPYLFYTSAFIGELHKRASPDVPYNDPELDAEATRLGSRALFYSAILSLASNLLLPLFVSEAANSRRLLERNLGARSMWRVWYERVKVHLATLWAISHLVFAACMMATFFYSSVRGATFFTMLTGFSWSITQWAPFSLLAEAILTETGAANEDAGSIVLQDTRTRHSGDEQERAPLVGDGDDADERALEDEVRSFRSSASIDSPDGMRDTARHAVLMGNTAARLSHLDVRIDQDADVDADGAGERGGAGLAAKAGIIIGIHNIFVVMPQFIMTAVASVVFAILEPDKSALGANLAVPPTNTTVPHNSTMENAVRAVFAVLRDDDVAAAAAKSRPNSYAIVFRLGGISAAIALVLTVRLARELRHR